MKRLTLLGLLLAGCVSSPEPPPATFPPAEFHSSEAPRIDWSGGLSLPELQAAVARHGRARAALEALDVARAKRVTAETYPLNPELEFEGAQGFGGDNSEAGLGVRQAFELGGRGARREEVADAGIARAGAESQDALRELRARAARLYWAAVSASRQAEIAAQAVTIADKAVEISQTRFDARQATALDLNLAKVAAGKSRAAAKRAEGEATAARAAVAALAGETAPAGWTLADRLPAVRPRADAVRALAAAAGTRPDLAVLDASSRESWARAELARAEAAPDLGVGVGYRFERDRIEGDGVDFRKVDHSVTVGLTLTLPLWNRREGEIAEAEADRRRFLALHEALLQDIAGDVAAAAARLEAADEALSLYESEILPAASKNLEDVRAAYGLGALTISDLLRAQADLQSAVAEQVDAEASWLRERAELEASVGAPLESFAR